VSEFEREQLREQAKWGVCGYKEIYLTARFFFFACNFIQLAKMSPSGRTDEITVFRIPSECFIISHIDWKSREPRTVWYGMPVETEYARPNGGTAITRCVVKAFRQDGETVGYLTLPLRYAAAWTQLCYTVVYWASVWEGWMKEAGRKRRAVRDQSAHDLLVLCINNSAARLGKYLYIRRLIVEELLQHTFSEDGESDELDVFDEYLIRDRFDWLWTKRVDVPQKDVKYLSLDPVHSSNRRIFDGRAELAQFSFG
jgi:hypothetical protein